MATRVDVLPHSNSSYVHWETDVNLNPPKTLEANLLKTTDEDTHLQTHYNTMQNILYETGYPETIDRTVRPRKKQNKEFVNVAIFSSPGDCIGILLEGGKQLPDGFHLVLSPSWLSKAPSEEDSSLNTLLLHKSISFHAGGATFIDEFDPPRRVTYFANNFNSQVTNEQRDNAAEVETALDCPMGSSAKLYEIVKDKVWTRDIMAEAGMEIPETLAFRRSPTRKLSLKNNKMKCIDFDNYETINMANVEKDILAFSNKLQRSQIQKTVVKASGPIYNGSLCMSIHDSDDVTSILWSAKQLLMTLDKRCSVLVEEYAESIGPMNIDTKHAHLWSANDALGFRTHVTVCRDHDGTPVTTLIQCAITERFSTKSDDDLIWQTLDSTLLAFNVSGESTRRELERKIRTQAAVVLKANASREALLTNDERGPSRAQTDIIGIDMNITWKEEELVPVGIAFSNHYHTQVYDFMMQLGHSMMIYHNSAFNRSMSHDEMIPVPFSRPNYDRIKNKLTTREINGHLSSSISIPETELAVNGFSQDMRNIQESRFCFGDTFGGSVKPLVRNMISRSQRYLIRGKQVIVLTGGGYGKSKHFPIAAKYGIKVILVDRDPNHRAREHVYRFIEYNLDDHSKDEQHADEIISFIRKQNIKADGCLTFWEQCVPLAGLINEKLGTKGVGYYAAVSAKKKSRSQNLVYTWRSDIPHLPRANLYSSLALHLKTESDCMAVPENFTFPAMLKLEYGMFAIAAAVVKDKDELKTRYLKVTNMYRSEPDLKEAGVSHGNAMMATEYYVGSEHNIDVIIYERKLVGAFITDSGRARKPYFTVTGKCMPSTLPGDKQAQLITASYQCCIAIGSTHGLYNVEMILTATGPKLVEINGRMGGYCFRDWVSKLYGVDTMLYAMMIASDIKPCIPKHPANLFLMGVMLLPSVHATIWNDTQFRSLLNEMIEKEEIFFTQFSDKIETADPGHEIAFANVAVLAPTAHEAKSKLIAACKTLGVDREDYRVKEILQYF